MKEYDLYVTVIPSKGLEGVSYAQDFLIKMVEKRKLRSFCLEHNVSHTDIYRMAIGTRQPGYFAMMMLRYVIHPVLWFVELGEKKPNMKTLNTNVENTDFHNTKAFKKLYETTTKKWAELGFEYQPVYCLKTGKINNITFTRMQEFAEYIDVQDWFIYLK